MISRFFIYIFNTIIWHFIFRFITNLNFRTITNNFRVQLLTTPIFTLYQILRNLVLNRNNFIFRFFATTPGIDPNDLINSNSKKFFG